MMILDFKKNTKDNERNTMNKCGTDEYREYIRNY